MKYLQRSRELQEEWVEIRRNIHQEPEIGLLLPHTVAFVKEKLREMGYEPQEIGGGVTCTVGNGKKVILLRGDMDALPMKEESELAFKSHNDYAHTCGHDLHTTMLLGAAKLLKENEEQLQGTVKFMFQPGEEILKGAKSMIEHGILENPRPDAALSSHVFSGHHYDKVFVQSGPLLTGCYGFEIEVTGKGCHGAEPQKGIDAINIGVHIHLALQELIAREIDFRQGALLTIGQFTAGTAGNIIPGTALLKGTIRTFDEETREYLLSRLTEVVRLTAEQFRGSAEVRVVSDVPVLMNDADITSQVRAYLKDMEEEEIKVEDGLAATASEDFSFVAREIPSTTIFFGASDMTTVDEKYPMHHPKVQFDERVLYRGAAMYATIAEEWLKNNK